MAVQVEPLRRSPPAPRVKHTCGKGISVKLGGQQDVFQVTKPASFSKTIGILNRVYNKTVKMKTIVIEGRRKDSWWRDNRSR